MKSRNLSGRWAGILAVSLLMGCSSTERAALVERPAAQDPANVVLATPLQVSYQNELALARLGQLLASDELSSEQRAELYYERGVVFDRVGLRTMARIDFSRALRERPDFAEAYNFVGVYLTQQQNFEEAYDAFDSALELAPNYDYAYLNRGIALYYGARPALAAKDLSEFYRHKPEDPYRVLWLYLAEQRVDPAQALQDLQRRFKQHGGNEWGWNIVAVFAGQSTEADFIHRTKVTSHQNRELAERLCEAYFYLGKRAQIQGEQERAANLFKLSLANNVYDFIEHRYAMLELELMAPSADASRTL